MSETDTAQSLLSALMRCQSVTPDDAGTLDILERFLTPLGFTCTRLTFEGDGSYPVANLFATRGTSGKHLLFAGHVDVVPIGAQSDWTHPPFDADIADGFLWGRGSVDMKSGVAAYCAALSRVIESGEADGTTLSLAITADEEADAINGTDKLIEWAVTEGHAFDFAIVGEPSSAQSVGDRIKIGRRGSFNGIVRVTGQQGHVAYPEQARNPLPVLARAASALNGMPLDDGSAHFQPSNLEITSIDVGNSATNVIPQQGTLRFNVRFNDHWDATKLEQHIKDILMTVEAEECDLAFERIGRPSPGFICPPGEDVAALAEAISKATGHAPEFSTSGGTSDARFIARHCPVVECGLVGARMHAVDERVPLADLALLTDIYARFVSTYARGASA